MTYPYETSDAVGETRSGLIDRILNYFGQRKAKRVNNMALKDLASQDYHLLEDIGVTRFDLESAMASRDTEHAAYILMRTRQNPLKKRHA